MAIFSGRKRVLGLDVGSKLIKAIEIEHLKDGYLVTNVAIAETPEGSVLEGEITSRDEVIASVNSLLRSYGIKTKDVVTAVAGKDVIIKRITVDKMGEAELREVIRWEAAQHIPFEIEDVVLDFHMLGALSGGNQMEVLLVAAKKDKVEEKMNLMSDCGLNPVIIDVDSFAINNAFEYNYRDELAGMKCLINMGKDLTTLIVYQDGVLLLARDVVSGTGAFTEELQRAIGLEKEEAESSLLGVIPEGRSPEELRTIIFSISDRLLRNIERANSYIKTSGLGGGIDTYYMCGGGAKVPWLMAFLKDKLGKEVLIPDPFRSVPMKEGVVEDRIKKEMGPMVMLSVGLAMRGEF
jgi:type IV pilus assembly protein PilM